jgi:hypothetical protein
MISDAIQAKKSDELTWQSKLDEVTLEKDRVTKEERKHKKKMSE